MNVWLVFAGWPYEGDDVMGVFTTKEEADALVSELKSEEFPFNNICAAEYTTPWTNKL